MVRVVFPGGSPPYSNETPDGTTLADEFVVEVVAAAELPVLWLAPPFLLLLLLLL